MATGYTKSDPVYGTVDLDDEYITEQELVNKSSGGNLYFFGTDSYYGSGLGSFNTTYSTPVQVGTKNDWARITTNGPLSGGIKTNGELWMWGRNLYGEVGDGTTNSRSTPIQIGTDTNWKDLSCGYYSTMAIKTDDTLWAWGLNHRGQLGLNDTTDRSSPVQVGNLTNWKKVFAGSGNAGTTMAIKTDGTLWSWGRNNSGQLGLGDTTDRSSPVQVGSLTNWKSIMNLSYGWYAIKTDGTLWTNNVDGGISIYEISSPLQLGTDNNWWKFTSNSFGLLALQNNGSIWNVFATDKKGVWQFGTQLDWREIAGYSNADSRAALKKDGTVWVWGDFNGSSTPVQLTNLNNWKTVVGSYRSFFLLGY